MLRCSDGKLNSVLAVRTGRSSGAEIFCGSVFLAAERKNEEINCFGDLLRGLNLIPSPGSSHFRLAGFHRKFEVGGVSQRPFYLFCNMALPGTYWLISFKSGTDDA